MSIPDFGSDSDIYIELAKNLLAGHGFTLSRHIGMVFPSASRHLSPCLIYTPGYPSMLAAFGLHAYLLAFVLWLVVMACAWTLLKRPAFILFALQPMLLMQLHATASDLMATAAVSVFVLGLVRRRYALMMVGCAVALMTRIDIWIFMALVSFLSIRAKPAVVLNLILIFLMITARGLRYEKYTGQFSMGTEGPNVYANYEKALVGPGVVQSEIKSMKRDFKALCHKQDSLKAQEITGHECYGHVLESIARHPTPFVRTVLWNELVMFLGRDYYQPFRFNWFLDKVSWVIWMLIPFVMLLLSCRRNPIARSVFLYLLIHAIVLSQARYRLPMEIIMWGGIG